MILSDAQDFGTIGFAARVVCIPGHTKGSIGILTAEGNFFRGNTINCREKHGVADAVENENQLAESLVKILKLSTRNISPGHGNRFPMADLKF